MRGSDEIDVAIVGGGPGGIIALYYARQAGLDAVVLERQDVVGGLWAQLPSWQDIQNREEDWTLGDIPIAGVDQPSIVANIRQWVHKFDLAEHIRLNSPAISASPLSAGWDIQTPTGKLRAKALISATGGHNRAFLTSGEATLMSMSFILRRFAIRAFYQARPLSWSAGVRLRSI